MMTKKQKEFGVEVDLLRRPRIDGFPAGRVLRRYCRGVFGFIGVRGKIV